MPADAMLLRPFQDTLSGRFNFRLEVPARVEIANRVLYGLTDTLV